MSRIADVLEDGGQLAVIVQDGGGVREHWPVVGGRKMRRVIYLYREKELASAATDFISCGELQLADELLQQHWRAYLFSFGQRTV